MMKKQIPITKILIQATAAVIAIAAAPPLRAADSLSVFGDFNNDSLVDVAAVTAPTTITVSLAKPNGSYVVSAILMAPKNQKITYVGVVDRDGDGDLDVYASCPAGGGWVYTHMWSGNADGTFGFRTTEKWSWPPKGHYGSW
jgi:hypothetical protein